MVKYHDEEWGVPEYDSKKLFAKLSVDIFQAGLSWKIILYKIPGMMEAFDNFDPNIIIRYTENDVQRLLSDERMVRNQAKIRAIINNAQKYLELEKEQSFGDYLWGFVGGKPIVNNWETQSQIPDKTPLAEEITRDLKKRGFKFLGPTIVYAFMQGVGLVNDHIFTCKKYPVEHA